MVEVLDETPLLRIGQRVAREDQDEVIVAACV